MSAWAALDIHICQYCYPGFYSHFHHWCKAFRNESWHKHAKATTTVIKSSLGAKLHFGDLGRKIKCIGIFLKRRRKRRPSVTLVTLVQNSVRDFRDAKKVTSVGEQRAYKATEFSEQSFYMGVNSRKIKIDMLYIFSFKMKTTSLRLLLKEYIPTSKMIYFTR